MVTCRNFPDENFKLTHDKPGLLSMVRSPIRLIQAIFRLPFAQSVSRTCSTIRIIGLEILNSEI